MPISLSIMAFEEPDFLLDISATGQPVGPGAPRPDDEVSRPTRPWIGVRFDCCGVYQRIYKNRQATAYEGRCPRCTRVLRVKVGAGGTDARFFVAE